MNSLTPEERQHIYEEEKARQEAQEKLRKKKGPGFLMGCLIFVLIIIGIGVVGSMFNSHERPTTQSTYSSPPAPAPRDATILLKITKATYEYGYLKISGIATNKGPGDAFSPTILIEVYDASGKTLIGQDHVWPTGQYLSTMSSGASAGFESIIHVNGEPSNVRYQISVDKFRFEVKWP